MQIQPTTVGSVFKLRRHPVKSMLGEEIAVSPVTERGLVGDRAYALLDTATGRTVSAKNPLKWPRMFECRAWLAQEPSLEGPVPAACIELPVGRTVRTDEPDAATVLSEALGRLVGIQTVARARPRIESFSPELDGTGDRGEVSEKKLGEQSPAGTFFDYSAVHVITTATLEHMQRLSPGGRFEAPRFRANIVIDTGARVEGFVENDWAGHTLGVGEAVRLAILIPARRCVMTTLEQGDLPHDPEIFRALVRHNSIFFAEKGGSYPCLGVFAKVLCGGVIRQGDSCRLE